MTAAQKKSSKGPTGKVIGLAIVAVIAANVWWNLTSPEHVADHSGEEHWSIFTELLPEALFANLGHMIGPGWLFGDHGHVSHIIMAILAFILGIGFALAARRRFAAATAEERLLPPRTWSALAVFDLMIDALLGLMETLMPREMALRALPLITAFATFIFISNFLGLVPGLLPPTDSLNTTMALALVSFLYYNYWGIRKQGIVAYIKHLMGPSIWLAPLMFPLEIISHFVRPVSLAVRLMGNMFGDHLVLGIFLGFHILFVPMPVMLLGLVVVTVQTAVFTLLSIVYVAVAVEVHDHDHDHDHGAEHARAHA